MIYTSTRNFDKRRWVDAWTFDGLVFFGYLNVWRPFLIVFGRVEIWACSLCLDSLDLDDRILDDHASTSGSLELKIWRLGGIFGGNLQLFLIYSLTKCIWTRRSWTLASVILFGLFSSSDSNIWMVPDEEDHGRLRSMYCKIERTREEGRFME